MVSSLPTDLDFVVREAAEALEKTCRGITKTGEGEKAPGCERCICRKKCLKFWDNLEFELLIPTPKRILKGIECIKEKAMEAKR